LRPISNNRGLGLTQALAVIADTTQCCLRDSTQRQREGRTFSEFALEPDPSAMQFDVASSKRKPQAGALLLVGVVVTDLPELLEHCLVILRRDANPGVRHGDLDRVTVRSCAHIDATAIRGEQSFPIQV
jgi:hypothetical protein